MRVAFLVLNHRQPAQLVRLLAALRSQLPDSPIVVHHDTFHGEISPALIESFGNAHLLSSGKRVVWGDSGIAEVCHWSLTWMRDHLDFDWVVLLSAQDYPVKPLTTLAADLARNGAEAVIQATSMSQLRLADRINIRHRYFFQYRPMTVDRPGSLPAGVRSFVRRHTRSLVALLNIAQPLFKLYRLPDGLPYRFGWRARWTPFDRGWPCWKGSSWFALSRSALEYVLGYMADHPGYVEYCRRTMHPDESMFATVICNSRNFRVADRDVTYTRWTDDIWSPHPDTFRVADLDELLSVPHYFARKFDIDQDSLILDKLDEALDSIAVSKADT